MARRHKENCPECKEAVYKLLEKIYGKVEEDFKFEVSTKPDDFKDTPYYNNLKEIYTALQNHRGFNDLVRRKTLPRCDFFVPDPGFVIEFDEPQHFTLPRKIALQLYPDKLQLGFNKKRWINLCEQLNRHDNDKRDPYRDEKRAWYETLRDFLPEIIKIRPTVRLFPRDLIWCELNPEKSDDLAKFKLSLGVGDKK